MAQTFRLEKGSALTYQEGDDNMRFPHLWDITKTFKEDMVVFDGSDFYYVCIQDVVTPNTIALNNASYWKQLSQQQTLNLGDLGDVVITSPVAGQGIRFDGVNWVNDDGTLSIITVTHTQLQNLISTNSIVPGVYYRVEYTNVHTIDGTSDNYTGPIENILLIGITVNSLSKEAFSESFPNDTIFYDPTNITAEDGVTSRPGFIERRINNDNSISAPFDFRNTKVRRYRCNNSIWAPTTGYSRGDVVKSGNVLYGCIESHTSTASFATDSLTYWVDIVTMDSPTWGEYIIPAAYNQYITTELGGFNVTPDVGDSNDYDVFADLSTTRNVHIAEGIGTSASNQLGDIAIDTDVSGVRIEANCASVNIGRESKNNRLTADSQYILIGAFAEGNLVSSSRLIALGDYAADNELLADASRCSIGVNTIANKISQSTYSSISANSDRCVINDSLRCSSLSNTRTNIVSNSSDSIFRTGSSNNVMSVAANCIVGVSGKRNTIFDSSDVVMTGDGSYNDIKSLTTGTFADGANSNEVMDVANVDIGANTVGCKVLSSTITIGEDCYNLEILPSCDASTFGDGCENIIVSSVGSIIIPAGSKNCSFRDSGSISFTDLNTANFDIKISGSGGISIGSASKQITIENGSGSINIGDSCEDINISVSGGFTIGNNNNAIRMSNCSNVGIGEGNSNVEMRNCSTSIIGDGNVGCEIIGDTSSVVGNDNFYLKLLNTISCTIVDDNLTLKLEESHTCSIGSNNKSLYLFESTLVNILSNCIGIYDKGTTTATINSGCENIHLKSCLNVLVPPTTHKCSYFDCETLSFTGTPIVEGCEFSHFDSSVISNNMSKVKILQQFSNKTINAAYTNVVIGVSSNITEVLAVTKTDRNYVSKSPDGNLWAQVSDNLGNITNESLS